MPLTGPENAWINLILNAIKLLAWTFLIIFVACQNPEPKEILLPVIPQPNKVKFKAGVFKVKKNTGIYTPSEELENLAKLFTEQSAEIIQILPASGNKADIKLGLTENQEDEAYLLEITNTELK